MRLETILGGYAERDPRKRAVVCGERQITYLDLYDSSLRVARGLRELELGVGDRILVYLPNGIEFVQLLYGAFHLGAIVVPANIRLAAPELGYLIADCRPAVFVFDSEMRETVDNIEELDTVSARIAVGSATDGETAFGVLLDSDADGPPLPDVPVGQDECMICYTSGTTGQPKGAVITHANLLVQHGFINAIEWGLNLADRYLVTTPLAHRTGLGRLVNALCLGGAVVVMSRFDAARVIDIIQRERITVIGMVPTVARMLLPNLRQDPDRCRSLRRIIVTGEAFPEKLKEEIIQLLPDVQLCSFFAMTEVGAVTSLGHREQFTHASSVGRPTPGVEVRLVDEHGDGVHTGEVGEMLVRSGRPGHFNTMKGYYQRPEATAATIRDGWIRTGDMARLDADGYLYIVDRKKDMVLSGGFNIYTKEVERTLTAHSGVAEAAVVGIPDPVFGEAVVAFVQPTPDAALTDEELLRHCKAHLASYKKPKYIHFVDSLPLNPLGKVLKTRLRELAIQWQAASEFSS